MAKERNCIFCGKSYVYCPNCKEYSSNPKWMFNFDSEKCHDLYDAISGYNIGVKTKEDVKLVLDKYSITDYSEFSEKLQRKLNGMFGGDTSDINASKHTVEEPIISDEVNEDVVIDATAEPEIISAVEEPTVNEPVIPQRSRRMRRKNYGKTANTEE